jgi:hypothetical protein
MPKKELLLWAPRATGTLPPLGREKGGAAAVTFAAAVTLQSLTRARAKAEGLHTKKDCFSQVLVPSLPTPPLDCDITQPG